MTVTCLVSLRGLKIYARFTVPRGERPASGWPVVISTTAISRPISTAPRALRGLCGRLCAARLYRAALGLSRAWRFGGVATGGSGSPDYTIDVLNGLASVKRFPARLGADRQCGAIDGRRHHLRAMVLTPDIKARVIWAGVVASYPDLLARASRTPRPLRRTRPPPGGVGRASCLRVTAARKRTLHSGRPSRQHLRGRPLRPSAINHGTEDKSVRWNTRSSWRSRSRRRAKGGAVHLSGDDHNIAQNWGRR
jgi:hypothetical protein